MKKIIFVYNANSGWHNSVVDSLHKIVSPKTYACNLCAITHGAFSENEIWKEFRETSTVSMEFLHKDEFLDTYGKNIEGFKGYPVILKKEKDSLVVWYTAEEINKIKKTQDLIAMLEVNSL